MRQWGCLVLLLGGWILYSVATAVSPSAMLSKLAVVNSQLESSGNEFIRPHKMDRWADEELVSPTAVADLTLERPYSVSLLAPPLLKPLVPSLPNTVVSIRAEPHYGASLLAVNVPLVGLELVGKNKEGLGSGIGHGRYDGFSEVWLQLRDEVGVVGWVPAGQLPSVDVTGLPVVDWGVAREGALRAWPATAVFEWGGQTHDMRHLAEMKAMGMDWVKVQYKWRPDSQPSDVVDAISRAHQYGFKILLAIPGEPYPERIPFADYVTFLGQVAALADPPDAIEVWNEMNIDFEWPVGEIDPTVYVQQMLAPTYQAIKEVNPTIMVISGAPAPTGFDDGIHAWADERYVAGMADAGASQYADCIGIHYNAGATSPHVVSGHPAGAFAGWYFRPSLEAYRRIFPSVPLCLTEIGYLSRDGLPDLPARFWWGEGTRLADQAQWLLEARELARSSGYVRLFIIFSVDIHHWGDDPQAGYSLIRPDGSCPACGVLGGGQ